MTESAPNASPTATVSVDTPRPLAERRIVGRVLDAGPRYGLIYAWIVMIIIYGALASDTFLTVNNFQAIFNLSAPTLLLCLAITPLLLAGEIDLSVAGTFGLSSVLTAYLNVTVGLAVGWAILVALLVGVMVGAVNAFLIVGQGIGSLVVTLGMSSILAGAALGVTNLPISGVSNNLINATGSRLGGLQVAFYGTIVAVAVLYYVWQFTPLGRYLFFVGANRDVAQLSGIPVARVRTGAIVFGSLLAALAGVVLVGVQGSADPSSGPDYLLPVYAAVFLGSTVLTPGRFNPLGTAIAVFFLQCGTQGLQLLGETGWVDQTFYGASLVGAVALPRLLRRRSRRAVTS